MEFRTKYSISKEEPIFSDSGQRYADQWVLCKDAKTDFDIEISEKKKDLQAEINSYKDMCDINKILERFTRGDISAIGDPRLLSYGDISNLPESTQELYNNVSEAYKVWDSLDPSIKAQFTDISDFYNSIGTDKFLKAITPKNEDIPIEPTTEASV